VEKIGLRGNASARVDDKGRLKVPTIFRGLVHEQSGPDIYVTSLTGDCVRVYPMQTWIEIEEKLKAVPSSHPAKGKFLDRTSFYGSIGELDGQGRFVISPLLREHAAIVGEVYVLGRINHIEVWNVDRFTAKLQREQWTDADGLSLSEFGI
jgi:MraZ protein